MTVGPEWLDDIGTPYCEAPGDWSNPSEVRISVLSDEESGRAGRAARRTDDELRRFRPGFTGTGTICDRWYHTTCAALQAMKTTHPSLTAGEMSANRASTSPIDARLLRRVVSYGTHVNAFPADSE